MALVWEEEIYNEFKFKKLQREVFVFEAEHQMAALYFADGNEAAHFEQEVQKARSPKS